MDWVLLKAVADQAGAVLMALKNAQAEARSRWQAAIANLQDAVVQTQLYASSLERGVPANRTAEERLVNLWWVAANGFYALDGALAERLQLKTEYWTQPEIWTSEQVRDAGIAFQHVAEHTRQLLHEGR